MRTSATAARPHRPSFASGCGGLPVSWLRWLVLVSIAACMAGCANTKAVAEFGKQTARMTDVVKKEFGALETICTKRAELAINVANRDDDLPLKDCRDFKQAQGNLGKYTADVLDELGKALAGLADDKNFDLSSDISGVGKAVGALKDKSGTALVKPAVVDAFTKVIDLIADLATSRMRQDAVKRVVQTTDSMKTLGDLLKAYFVPVANSPIAGQKPPYQNWVEIGDIHLQGTDSLLSGALARQEPIRSKELRGEVKALKTQLAERTQAQGKVPAKIADAIDTWKLAVDIFKEEALKPDPQDLYKRLKELQEKTNAAKDAIEKANS
jgi:hypothetical protein